MPAASGVGPGMLLTPQRRGQRVMRSRRHQCEAQKPNPPSVLLWETVTPSDHPVQGEAGLQLGDSAPQLGAGTAASEGCVSQKSSQEANKIAAKEPC